MAFVEALCSGGELALLMADGRSVVSEVALAPTADFDRGALADALAAEAAPAIVP